MDREIPTASADINISEALRIIEKGKLGLVFIVEDDGKVVGILTDGDIRRALIAGKFPDDGIASFINANFTSVPEGSEREHVLKLLDRKIRVIPVLDSAGRICDLVTRYGFELEKQHKVYTRARSPARVSFGGGGTDLTHYFFENGGVVMNAAISVFSHATLRRIDDMSVRIHSADLNETVEASSPDALEFDGKLDLIKSAIKLLSPQFGFHLEIWSEFPVGSGLGGSAVVLSAVIGCFNELREDRLDHHEVAQLAFQAERLQLDIPGGWQDQYATVFGGFKIMEFSSEENVILPIRLEPRTLLELEDSLLLCYSGQAHNSGDIHDDQKKRMLSEEEASEMAQLMKDITHKMKRHLLRGRLVDYGLLLHEAWELKRRFSPLISNDYLDRIYNSAREGGAIGGKLLGAGGGGYFLFFVPPFRRPNVVAALLKEGLSPQPFIFDEQGLRTWSVRIREGDKANEF